MGDDAALEDEAGKRSKSKYLCEKHGHMEFCGQKHRCPKESCSNILKRLCSTCDSYFSYTHISNHKKVCQEDASKSTLHQIDSSPNQITIHPQTLNEHGYSSISRFHCKTHGPQRESTGTYRCPQENCGHSLKRLCVFCEEYFWSSTLWHHRPKCQLRISTQHKETKDPKETKETKEAENAAESQKKRPFEQTIDSSSQPQKNPPTSKLGDNTNALITYNAGANQETVATEPPESSTAQNKLKCSFSLLLDTSSVLMEAQRNAASTIETMPVRIPSFHQNNIRSIPTHTTQSAEGKPEKIAANASEPASSS